MCKAEITLNSYNRKRYAKYYDWEDLIKIPDQIMKAPYAIKTKHDLTLLRDKILIQIYVIENVVRDNI